MSGVADWVAAGLIVGFVIALTTGVARPPHERANKVCRGHGGVISVTGPQPWDPRGTVVCGDRKARDGTP